MQHERVVEYLEFHDQRSSWSAYSRHAGQWCLERADHADRWLERGERSDQLWGSSIKFEHFHQFCRKPERAEFHIAPCRLAEELHSLLLACERGKRMQHERVVEYVEFHN